MKRILYTAILLLSFATCAYSAPTEKPRFFSIGWADKELLNVGWGDDINNMEWGLMNIKGNLIMAPKHQEPLDFSTGPFTVGLRNGKYGIMNKAGKNNVDYAYDQIILNGDYAVLTAGKNHQIWFTRKFKNLGKINEEKTGIGPIAISEDLILAQDTKTNKYGYLNYDGKTVIPFQYDEALPFKEGLACVSANNRIFYIDPTGNKAFGKDFINPYPEEEFNLNSFVGGLAVVSNEEYKAGAINKNGETVIPFSYKWITTYPNGYAEGTRDDESGNEIVEIFDPQGNKIMSGENICYYDPESGIFAVCEKSSGKESYYFANKEGSLFNGQKFDKVEWFNNGYAFVKFPGEEAWSVIDTEGNVIFRNIASTTQFELFAV